MNLKDIDWNNDDLMIGDSGAVETVSEQKIQPLRTPKKVEVVDERAESSQDSIAKLKGENTSFERIILNTLKEAPAVNLLYFCDTDDRINHWGNLKIFSLLFHESFKAYFSGQSWQCPPKIFFEFPHPTIPNLMECEEIDVPKHLIELINSWQNYFLNLYNIIWRDWENFFKLSRKGFPVGQSPGEFLSELINLFILCGFLGAFPEIENGNYFKSFSSRKFHEDLRATRKLSDKIEKGIPLTKAQQKKFSRLIAKQKKEENHYWGLFNLAINTILQTAEKSAKRNKLLEKDLEYLFSARADLDRVYLKISHPRNNCKGFAWEQGKRLEATGFGGVYK
jgi:hypothetical protein